MKFFDSSQTILDCYSNDELERRKKNSFLNHRIQFHEHKWRGKQKSYRHNNRWFKEKPNHLKLERMAWSRTTDHNHIHFLTLHHPWRNHLEASNFLYNCMLCSYMVRFAEPQPSTSLCLSPHCWHSARVCKRNHYRHRIQILHQKDDILENLSSRFNIPGERYKTVLPM